MTHPEPDPRDTLRAAAALEGSMAGLRGEMAALRQRGKRNRNWIVGLAVSLTLDIILSVVVAVVAVQASQANDLAHQNRQSQVATCDAGNQARAVSVSLWNYVLDLSSKDPENQSPQRKQQIEQFRSYMQGAYAQRDCTQPGS